MSWCDRRAVLWLLLGLGGCGFHPLYAENSPLGYDPALASVEVRPVPDRIGQILVQSIREQLNPRGVRVKPRYVLSIAITVVRADLGIRRDNTSSRGELTIAATLKLSPPGSDKSVLDDALSTVTSFNRPDDAYAATVAEDSASNVAAADLGRQIAQRIAVYLRHEPREAGT
ncbi:MAG TPA: LPS assembly lipoprotein LptE [Stellaceae bacterium]|nr:LPS assembly lipoprotein LptE [Stellaceae bacterium]